MMRFFVHINALASRFLDLLLWIGLVRRNRDGSIRWPVSTWSWEGWKVFFLNPFDPCFGWGSVFRNRRARKWEPGRLLPRRWGFRFLGLEIGDRG